MDVLMVAGELGPYARITAAADSVAALSKALAQTGHEVTVVLPRYSLFEESGLLVARRLTPLKLPDGPVTVFDGQLSTGVKIALLDVPSPEQSGSAEAAPYPPDTLRMGYFCRAAAALVRQRSEQGQAVDVVHLHDWSAAPVAPLCGWEGARPGLVLTIHDGDKQGVCRTAQVPEWLATDVFAIDGQVNFLKAGALTADVVATVSTGYAADLERGMAGAALATALAGRREPIMGVLNGLDYAIYNPATDSALRSRFDAEDPSAKGSAKAELLRASRLDLSTERPFAVVLVDDEESRNLLQAALHELLKTDASFLFAGREARALEQSFQGDRGRLEGVCAFGGPLDDAALRRACAAADLFVSPRSYDADCFVPRASQRYGAVPVAFAAGAVRDAIVDCDAQLETGTGFLFAEYQPDAFLGAFTRGLAAYASARWGGLRRRVLRLDSSWDRPARRYAQLYRQAKQLAPGA